MIMSLRLLLVFCVIFNLDASDASDNTVGDQYDRGMTVDDPNLWNGQLELEVNSLLRQTSSELDKCQDPVNEGPTKYYKMLNRECEADKTGSYETLEEAMIACNANAHNECKGIYDDDCDGSQFSICPGPSHYNWSRNSCIIQKLDRRDW